jgi:hypothetical protein
METIQLTEQGLFLPRKRFTDFGEIEVVQGEDYILIKPKNTTVQFKEGEHLPVSVHELHQDYELSLLEKTGVTEEPSLYDVWRLLMATAARLDQLYAALDVVQEPLPPIPSPQPTVLHVCEHPFFGMIADASDDVPETMARLRENRHAAL